MCSLIRSHSDSVRSQRAGLMMGEEEEDREEDKREEKEERGEEEGLSVCCLHQYVCVSR